MRLAFIIAFLVVGLTACAAKQQIVYREYLPSTEAVVFPASDSIAQSIRKQLASLEAALAGGEQSQNLLKELDFGNIRGSLNVEEKRLVNGYWLRFYSLHDSKNGRRADTDGACIAISGGGIRSAAFALGVLEGLDEKTPLSSFRAISATSGGAYAMTALYAAALRSKTNLTAKLVESDKELQRVAAEPSFLSEALRAPLTAKVAIASIPSLLSSNFREGWTATGLTHDYATVIGNFWHGQSNWIYWEDWRQAVVDLKLPIPIIVTASLRKTNPQDNGPLTEQVFEWTPFVRGNFGLGYSDSFKSEGFGRLGVASVVAGAAAALDNPAALQNNQRLKLGLVLAGTESLLSAPLTRDKLDRFNEALRPGRPAVFPLEVKSPLRSTEVFHTDGGYADNLALYPLIRRGCASIIVIDSEHDPELKYCALAKIAADLTANHGVDVSVTNPTVGAALAAKALADPMGQRSMCEKYESQAFFEMPPQSRQPFLARTAPEPLFELTLSPWEAVIPSSKVSASSLRSIQTRIRYIKLARPASLDFLSPGEKAEVMKYESDYAADMAGCQFPHDITAKQAYSKEQFRAYRLLGKNMGAMAQQRNPPPNSNPPRID
jgi:predicted acylesterase/phospholipase RssA